MTQIAKTIAILFILVDCNVPFFIIIGYLSAKLTRSTGCVSEQILSFYMTNCNIGDPNKLHNVYVTKAFFIPNVGNSHYFVIQTRNDKEITTRRSQKEVSTIPK